MQPTVTMLDRTSNPIRIIAMAARLCYTKGMTIAQLNEKLTDEKCLSMVQKILEKRHYSCMEHAVFTVGIEGVSRNFTHQLVRHRNTSYEQQSLHYLIANNGFEVAAPSNLNQIQKLRWNQSKAVAFETYQDLIKDGVPREEARHILPSGIESKIMVTANLRQWMHFIKLRACAVNCHEIIVVAQKVRKLLIDIMPMMREHLGPTCQTEGVCYEGKKFVSVCKESPWKKECRIRGDGLDYLFTKKEPKDAE